MILILFGMIAAIAIPAVIGYSIALSVLKRLRSSGNKFARLLAILTFVGCFAILCGTILFGLSFIHLER
jgi:hypothetical protein